MWPLTKNWRIAVITNRWDSKIGWWLGFVDCFVFPATVNPLVQRQNSVCKVCFFRLFLYARQLSWIIPQLLLSVEGMVSGTDSLCKIFFLRVEAPAGRLFQVFKPLLNAFKLFNPFPRLEHRLFWGRSISKPIVLIVPSPTSLSYSVVYLLLLFSCWPYFFVVRQSAGSENYSNCIFSPII